jgi:hypothetical protein
VVEQLLPVDRHENITFALRDQPRPNGCLPESCRSTQNAFVMANDLRDSFLLDRSKLSLELSFNRGSREPFVANVRPNLVRFKKGQCLR